MWPDATGNFGQPAILSEGLTSLTEDGHGALNRVTAIHGTRAAGSIKFGHVIKDTFTICSVTRYTSTEWSRQKRILNGQGDWPAGRQRIWYHGHEGGRAGVANYGGQAMTSTNSQLADSTDWLVMCGTNADSEDGFGGMLANGASAGLKTQGDAELHINSGWGMPGKASDFAVAEIIVWDRGLSEAEMQQEARRLHHLLLGNHNPMPPPPSMAPSQPPPPSPPLTPPSPPSTPWMLSPIVHLDASNPAGYSGANAVNLATGAEWTMKGDSTWCNRTMHNGVAVFDMEDPACHLETTERISYCNEGTGFGYTTATWIDWRDEDWRNYRVLHQPEGDEFVTAIYPQSSRLGVMSSDGGWREGGGNWHPANILTEGWSLVIAVGQ